MIISKHKLHLHKNSFILLLILTFSIQASAQFDFKNKPKPIAAPIISAKKSDVKSINQPLLIDFNKPKATSDLFPSPNAPKPMVDDLIKKNNFQNPNDILLKQLNKSENESEPDFKADNFLGNFRSNGKIVKIVCRDYGEIDGDKVRVYLNDLIVVSEIYLESNYKEVVINLVNGFNKIEFQALNQGSSGPNTAEFVMFDDKGSVISSNRWNLTTGTKAKIIVTKE